MKKRQSGMIGLGVLLAALGAHAAFQGSAQPVLVCGEYAKQSSTSQQDNCFSTCGGEIPWPFHASNQVVELANNEKYVLMGQIEFRNDLPRFVVDLEAHPWLGTAQRRIDSSYRLLGSVDYWKRFESRKIQLRAIARWLPSETNSASIVEVALESLADPAVVNNSGSLKESSSK